MAYRVKFSVEAEGIYRRFEAESFSSKTSRMLFEGIVTKESFLKMDRHYGEPIAKQKIPEKLKEQYGINNLFWVQLPLFWRMSYTIKNEEDEIIIFVVKITDHKEYDRLFGYSGK